MRSIWNLFYKYGTIRIIFSIMLIIIWLGEIIIMINREASSSLYSPLILYTLVIAYIWIPSVQLYKLRLGSSTIDMKLHKYNFFRKLTIFTIGKKELDETDKYFEDKLKF